MYMDQEEGSMDSIQSKGLTITTTVEETPDVELFDGAEDDDDFSLDDLTADDNSVQKSAMKNLKISIDNEGIPDPDVTFVKIESSDQDIDSKENIGMNPKIQVNLRSASADKKSSMFPSNPKVYENKSGSFVTGIDLNSQETVAKREERAKRFGLQSTDKNLSVKSLYESLGLTEEDVKPGNPRGIRPTAVMLRGVNNMSTVDIFSYFDKYPPCNLEWIDDSSCNVLWSDADSTNRALMNMSEPIKTVVAPQNNKDECTTSKDEAVDDDDEIEEGMIIEDDDVTGVPTDNSESLKHSQATARKSSEHDMTDSDSGISIDEQDLPPGRWRLGASHKKAQRLFMRLATKSDCKVQGAESRSEYYRRHGNPNYGNLPGLLSNSKKKQFRRERERDLEREAYRAVHGEDDLFGGIYVEPGDEPDSVSSVKSTEKRQLPHDLRELTSSAESVTRKRPAAAMDTAQDEEEKELEQLLQVKKPMMRMHADEEEEKMKSIRSTQFASMDVRSRINQRKQQSRTEMTEEEEAPVRPDLRSRLSRRNV